MGCLKVDITPVKGAKVDVRKTGDLSFSVSIVRKNLCRAVRAVVRCVNDLVFRLRTMNDLSSVAVTRVDSDLKVEVGLVCMTDLGTECYLQVLDGYLITVDGCFIKVNRS